MKNQLFVNADCDLFWWMYESVNGNIENFEEKIRKYVRGYANNGITDMLYCCFMQQSTFPSKVLDWYGDKYNQKIENGVEVDYFFTYSDFFIDKVEAAKLYQIAMDINMYTQELDPVDIEEKIQDLFT